MELKYGWICPLCGKALSPDTKACLCYKEKKKEDVEKKDSKPEENVKISPWDLSKINDPFPIYKWVKPYNPYEDQPFYTSGSSDPCEGCQNKGNGFCHCTLGIKTTY